MPRFYFDVLDDNIHSRDEHGIDLPDVSCVWEIAVPMVDEIAKSKGHRHPPHSVYVVVRDAADVVVYESRHLARKAQATASESISDRITSPAPSEAPSLS